MSTLIKARFTHGIIEPLETIDLPEGMEFTINVPSELCKADKEDRFLKAAGSWNGLIDAEELIQNIYAARRVSCRSEVKL
ncbi:MAG: DUF104 domain-containing protein [Nitrospirae bacterium]|nr:DUF104 domain-containing protein [Nitrospirota bacterium]